MNNMRKYLLLLVLVIYCLTACGKNDKKEDAVINDTENIIKENENGTEISTETEIEVSTESVLDAETTESEDVTEVIVPSYTYADLSKTMYASSEVNVRDLPTTDGNKLGALSKSQEVVVTGQCNESGWYRIDYNGVDAYVSNGYLVETKPVEEVSNNNTNSYNDYFTEANGYENGWHPIGDHAPYKIKNGYQTHCCIIVFGVHYELTEEVHSIVFNAGSNAEYEWLNYGKWAWNDGDGTVGIHVPNWFAQYIPYEEYELYYADSYTLFNSYEDYKDAMEHAIDSARYEAIMQHGYIQILK